jgi:hypothetical protein
MRASIAEIIESHDHFGMTAEQLRSYICHKTRKTRQIDNGNPQKSSHVTDGEIKAEVREASRGEQNKTIK